MANETTENNTEDTAAKEAEAGKAREEKFRTELQTSETARMKAEAERDAYVKAIELAQVAKTQPANISEDQWTELTTKTGLSKEAILANAEIAQRMVNDATGKITEKLTAAEKRASEAEEKATRIERSRETDRVMSKFYSDRVALARYSSDVEAFIGRFPEADRNDPKKLSELLGMAETYIKGKVGDKIMRQGTSTNSPKFEHGGEGTDTDTDEIDTKTFKAIEAGFVRHVSEATARDKEIKEYESRHGRDGVELAGSREWREAQEDMKKMRGR